MSDQEALLSAQLANANQELVQLRQVVRNLSAQCQASKQCIDELIGSNVSLRGSTLLLEDDKRQLSAQVNQNIARVNTLEAEKAELVKELEVFKISDPEKEAA
jgi:ribosomal protein L29